MWFELYTAKGEIMSKATNNKLMCPVDINGLDEGIAREIEGIIDEFEQEHEESAVSGNAGWVPCMKPFHYACAAIPNAAFLIWLVIAYMN